jgi:hypothetical protein
MTFDESTVACILVKVKITSIGEEHCFIIQSETLKRSSHLPFVSPAGNKTWGVGTKGNTSFAILK